MIIPENLCSYTLNGDPIYCTVIWINGEEATVDYLCKGEIVVIKVSINELQKIGSHPRITKHYKE